MSASKQTVAIRRVKKDRLDAILVNRGLAETRNQAQRMLLSGEVLVNGQPWAKPGHLFDPHVQITIKERPRFVSRGGEKLNAALDHFKIQVANRLCLDVGASTGGFTDCLLQRGAARVAAVDVGHGQLHASLRDDPRVLCLEGINARYMHPSLIPFKPSFACVDVSFISLTIVLPAIIQCLAPLAEIVALIKPQFEAGREHVQKGGVVRDPIIREAVLSKIKSFSTEKLHCVWNGCIDSPIRGPAGNIEILAHMILSSQSLLSR